MQDAEPAAVDQPDGDALAQFVREKKLAAILAVGPLVPGEIVDVVAAIARATEGPPGILALGETEAIGKRFPGFESVEVPTGAFRAHPARPAVSVTTLAVAR